MKKACKTCELVKDAGSHLISIETQLEMLRDYIDALPSTSSDSYVRSYGEASALRKAAGVMLTLIEMYEGRRGAEKLERRFRDVIDCYTADRARQLHNRRRKKS